MLFERIPNSEVKALSTDEEHGSLHFLWLEITNRCNLECTHCYAGSGPRAELTGGVSLEAWQKVIADAQSFGCSRVQIIGGEPTVHPDFSNILLSAREGFDFVEVYTNATTLTDSYLKLFSENEVQIATSVYSLDEREHDAVTLRSGSSARTLENIKRAIARGVSVRASVVETDNNPSVKRALIEEQLISLGVERVEFDRVRSIGRGQENTNKQGTHPTNAVCGACLKGRLCASYDGNFYPCVMSKFSPLGRIRDGVNAAVERKKSVSFGGSDPVACLPSNCLPDNCTP